MKSYEKHVLERDWEGDTTTLNVGSAKGVIRTSLSAYLEIDLNILDNVVRQFLLRNWSTRLREILRCDLFTYSPHGRNTMNC